jgi:hypothetical protein
MRRTRVSHPTKPAPWASVAFAAMAIATWPGCDLVPQTLPPDNGLSGASAPGEADAGVTGENDAAGTFASSSGGGASGNSSGGSGGPATFNQGGGADAAAGEADATAASDAGSESDAGLDAETGVQGDASASGNALDAAVDAAGSDGASNEIEDSGDNLGDASPADGSADVSPE